MDDVDRLLERTVADVTDRGLAPDLVIAVRTRWRGLRRVQGVSGDGPWTIYFEPVRSRWPLGSTWTQVRPLEESVALVESFLTTRPDQQPPETEGRRRR